MRGTRVTLRRVQSGASTELRLERRSDPDDASGSLPRSASLPAISTTTMHRRHSLIILCKWFRNLPWSAYALMALALLQVGCCGAFGSAILCTNKKAQTHDFHNVMISACNRAQTLSLDCTTILVGYSSPAILINLSIIALINHVDVRVVRQIS